MFTGNMMIDMAVYSAVLVGVGQVLKKVGVKAKWLPLINLILGVVIGILSSEGSILSKVINGAIIGLTSSGMYSGVKNTVEIL